MNANEAKYLAALRQIDMLEGKLRALNQDFKPWKSANPTKHIYAAVNIEESVMSLLKEVKERPVIRECGTSWVLSFKSAVVADQSAEKLKNVAPFVDRWVQREEGSSESRIRISKREGRLSSRAIEVEPFSTSTLRT